MFKGKFTANETVLSIHHYRDTVCGIDEEEYGGGRNPRLVSHLIRLSSISDLAAELATFILKLLVLSLPSSWLSRSNVMS